MSNRHFNSTMARRAKGDKVIEDICVILISVVPATKDVMNVQSSAAWTSLCATLDTSSVPLFNHHPNSRPVAAMLQTFTSAPMRTCASDHAMPRAGDRAISPIVITCECAELLAATHTGAMNCGNLGRVGACEGAKFHFGVSGAEFMAAMLAHGDKGSRCSPSDVTGSPAKNTRRDGAVRLTNYHCLAMFASAFCCAANRVYSARSRTMIDRRVVCGESITALEACLDH